MMAALFDLEPEPGPSDEPPLFGGEPMPSTARLMADTCPGAWSRASRLPGVVARTVGGLAGSAQAMVRQPGAVGRSPGTSFNGPLTARRTVAGSVGPRRPQTVAPLRHDHQRRGPGGHHLSLHSYLSDRDVHPDRPLVASVPVALARTADDHGFGNRTSNIMVLLPISDPVEALRSIHQPWGPRRCSRPRTRSARGPRVDRPGVDADRLGADLLSPGPGAVPPAAVQCHRLQRARSTHPALPGRRPGDRHVSDGSADREYRTEPDGAQPVW